MAFKDFVTKRNEDQTRIEAERKLLEARSALADVYTDRGARGILEGYGFEFNFADAAIFKILMLKAIDAGYDPGEMEDIFNRASVLVAEHKEEITEHAEARFFYKAVEKILEEGR